MSVTFVRFPLAAGFGSVLVGREAGRAAGDDVQVAVERHSAVIIGFVDVELASPSFVDELALGIRRAMTGVADRWVLVDGIETEDLRRALESALEEHRLTCAEVHIDDAGNETVRLLGGSKQLKRNLSEAEHFEPPRMSAVAAAFEDALPLLHKRLSALADANLLATVGAAHRHAPSSSPLILNG